MEYNVQTLTIELVKAGLPVLGVDSDGKISWARDLIETETIIAEAIKSNHDPSKVVSIEVNIFETLAKEFYNDEAVLNAWAKESIFVSNLLTDKSFIATAETVALLKARIQKSKDDTNSALTNDLADRLLAKVADIEAQLV